MKARILAHELSARHKKAAAANALSVTKVSKVPTKVSKVPAPVASVNEQPLFDPPTTALFAIPPQSPFSVHLPNFATLPPEQQFEAFEQWLSSATKGEGSTPAFAGGMRRESAHKYRLTVQQATNIGLLELVASDPNQQGPLDRSILALATAKGTARTGFLFPSAIFLAHAVRLSLLLHFSTWLKASPSLVLRAQCILKFLRFLRFVFAPPTNSDMDTQLRECDVILMRAKAAGSRFARERTRAREVSRSLEPPALGNMATFAAETLSSVGSLLRTCVERAVRVGSVKSNTWHEVTACVQV
jgi:hypothetical protein